MDLTKHSLTHRCPKIAKLSRIAEGYGGSVVRLKGGEKRFADAMQELGVQAAPFYPPDHAHGVGMLWKNKAVVYYGQPLWPVILHEMGHIFASKRRSISDEFNFFGWEYLIAKKIGGVREWLSCLNDYAVFHPETNEIVDIGDLSRGKVLSVLREAVRIGEDNGTIVNNKPVAVR